MKKYLITDPLFYGDSNNKFAHKLQLVLAEHKVDFICFRDKTGKNMEELAAIFLDISQKFKIPYIAINSNINLAHKLGFKTIHLNSSQINDIDECNNFFTTIVSTHNEQEILLAKRANFITYSPIFETSNKPNVKGVLQLEKIVQKYNKQKIFALGGIISSKEVELCKNTNCYGIASIRLFV